MIAYLGVDGASTASETALAIGGAKPRFFRRVGRSLELVKGVVEVLRRRDDVSEVHVVIESGALGWVQLFHEAGARVFVVDAAQSKSFSASLRSSGAKSDRTDASMLAIMGQSPAHAEREWKPRSDLTEAQDALGSLQFMLSNEYQRARQRLRAHLREHVLEVEKALNARAMDRRWSLRLLRVVLTRRTAAGLTRAQFMRKMKGSGARVSSLEAMWEAVKRCARHPEGELVSAARARQVRALVDQMENLSLQKAEAEAHLDELTRDLKLREQLESVKGIGEVLSQHLMAVGFDLVEAPTHRDEVAVRMGAAPVFVGTGDKRGGGKKGFAKMRRASSSLGKRTTYLLGRLASVHLRWAAAQYAAARARGKSAATAYRIVARSLLRILTAMIRTGEAYDDERYTQNLIERGVPWAAGLRPAAEEAA